MSQTLCLSIRFIQPFSLFHGRDDAGAPEWPPSPMRAFQALLNAAALRRRGKPLSVELQWALSVLETIRPSIIAPSAQAANVGYRLYVPHNHHDLVSAAWHRGVRDASIAGHRVEKDVLPTYLSAAEGEMPSIHFLYSLDLADSECQRLLDSIRPSVRSIIAFGWGIDQVAADATLVSQDDIAAMSGIRWRPARRARRLLPAPCRGSLEALVNRHTEFTNRIVNGIFTPVPPITAVDRAGYCQEDDAIGLPYAVFKLMDADEDTYRFPHARMMHVAARTRHAALEAMKQSGAPSWVANRDDWINRVVRGKRDQAAGDDHSQFSYIPLPSIGHAHADAMIRNVMLVAPTGMDRELEYLAKRLDGELLVPEENSRNVVNGSTTRLSETIALRRFKPPSGRFIANCYLAKAAEWRTVTPIILPGHDDKKPDKTRRLIQKALQQSGITEACTFTWQTMPFVRNCLSAHKYDRDGRHTGYHRPEHLKGLTAVHLWIRFDAEVEGPLAIGAGRHCGFGLMAAVDG